MRSRSRSDKQQRGASRFVLGRLVEWPALNQRPAFAFAGHKDASCSDLDEQPAAIFVACSRDVLEHGESADRVIWMLEHAEKQRFPRAVLAFLSLRLTPLLELPGPVVRRDEGSYDAKDAADHSAYEGGTERGHPEDH